jgi:hypothetical protein
MLPTEGQIWGWKDIASLLKVAERTAMRWEKDRGLPVHRVPGATRDAVFVTSDEIRSWLESDHTELRAKEVDEERPTPPSDATRQPSSPIPVTGRVRLVPAIILMIVAAVACLWYLSGSPGRSSHEQRAVTDGAKSMAVAHGSVAPVLVKVNVRGVVSRLGLRDGGCAQFSADAHTLSVCARLLGDALLVDIAETQASGGTRASESTTTLRLQPNAVVRLVQPFSFDIEWVETSKAAGVERAPRK